jgi:hypothetical protein
MMFPFAFLERCLCGRRGLSVLGFLLALLPRSVAAQSLPIELSWRAPPECPQQEVVLARAKSLLGAKALKVGSVHADGTIEKRDDGFELTLLIDEGGKGGERKVWARQCDELSGAAAIALVLLLTSGDRAADGTVPSGGDGQPGKPALPPKLPPPPPEQGDGSNLASASRSWHLLLALPQAAIGIGPLPKPVVGLGVGFGFQGRAWSVRLLGQWFSTQAVAAPVEPYGADVKRAAAGLWGCWDFHRADWSFSPCLQASAAHLRASGYGPFLLSQTQRNTSFAVGGGAIGRLQPLSWLAFMVGVGAQMELTRPLIVLGTIGNVRQLAPVSAIVQVGPEWIF